MATYVCWWCDGIAARATSTGRASKTKDGEFLRSGDHDVLMVELLRGDRSLVRKLVLVEVLRPLDRRNGTADWNSLAIDSPNGPVTKLFIAQPEASRHYHGADDLAAPEGRLAGDRGRGARRHSEFGTRMVVRLACGTRLEKSAAKSR